MIAGSVRAGIGVLGVIGLGSLGFALAPVSQQHIAVPETAERLGEGSFDRLRLNSGT